VSAVAAWWRRGVPPAVKVVYLLLLANGLPALVLLTFKPGSTDELFVWTVQPEASAHLLAAMYANALLLAALGIVQPGWAQARVTLVLIALFSLLATTVTFVHLDPFLAHPWYHLGYWLSMYLILCVLAPVTFVVYERREGGHLAVEVPLGGVQRVIAGATAAGLAGVGAALLAAPGQVADAWPWTLTPLVGRLVGVWLVSLGAAHAWALWDGDARRTKALFSADLPTAALLALVPLAHPSAVDGPLLLYVAVAAVLAASGAAALARRAAPVRTRRDAATA